ncbi:MAG: class I SAM-dependent methyltransferase [Candidatus Bathycorpusculaceae bacterium]
MVAESIGCESGGTDGLPMRSRLDVGCGAQPTGSVNVDLMVDDDDLRWDNNPKGYENFVKADINYLPFPDDCFDEVYCSHVLEHLVNPEKAIEELKRVSRKRVTVIVPCALFEVLDVFYQGRNIFEHRRWLRKHHKHKYWFRTFKNGNCRLKFVNLKDAVLYKRKSFGGKLVVPIPFEIETVIQKR